MKVKALRHKKEHNPYQDFVRIEDIGGGPVVFTSDIPKLQQDTATLKNTRDFYEEGDFYEGLELDWDSVELVEFDLIESGVIGADIRNKLGNYNNLVTMVNLLLDADDPDEMKDLKEFIKKEINQSKKTVEYLAKLF